MTPNILDNREQTMSSREIAELTGKRHDHVLRDVRQLSENYVDMGLPKVGESSYLNEQGVLQSNFGLSSCEQRLLNGGTRKVE